MMTGYPWVLAVLSLAGLPLACNSSGSGTGGSGGADGGLATADECNPITGAGCPADGSVCDLSYASGFFICYPPPNDVGVCAVCSVPTMNCQQGSTCLQTTSSDAPFTCYHYCCTAADCGPGGICDTAIATLSLPVKNPADAIGICLTSTTTEAPACSPPSTSPSGGTCVGGYSPSPDGGAGGSGDGGDGGAPDGG